MFVKKNSEAKEFEAGDNTILKELVHPMNDKINIGYSLAEARLPLGEASLPHKLSSTELYYILSGTGRLFVDGNSTDLKNGDSALVPADALQYIENTGSSELRFLCIVEPFWRAEGESIES